MARSSRRRPSARLALACAPQHCLDLITAFRARHPAVPIGILTYANIVAARGIAAFCGELAAAGADSLLVADVPSLEAAPYAAAARDAGIDLVMIAAPNTPRATLATIATLSSGYTYCVARAGVTGADAELALEHAPLFDRAWPRSARRRRCSVSAFRRPTRSARRWQPVPPA